MKLSELLENIEGISLSPEQGETEITSVTNDTRKVTVGGLFVAQKFTRFDGHDAVEDALSRGAAFLITERPLGYKNELTLPDTKAAYGRLCSAFAGDPAKKLRMVGVTGTNGKTTITSVVREMLTIAGNRVGLFGTIKNMIGDMVLPSKFTTPEPQELHAILARMVKAGCGYAVMEASSQGLAQGRLEGIEFDCAVFTNLTQDHLDFHKTFENYFLAKSILFRQAKNAVINLDDEMGRRLLPMAKGKILTYSHLDPSADIFADHIENKASGAEFDLCYDGKRSRVRFCMPGLYSVENALAACGVMFTLGFSFEDTARLIGQCRGVRGRCEVLDIGADFTVICDYAHTPDGLEKILSSIREIDENSRIITLFGCAGERDAKKRAHMSEAVIRYSDAVVITSDNPRREDPEKIIRDAIEPLQASGKPFYAVLDRYEAIKKALRMAKAGDILLLAGKGHEDYQVLADCTVYFDEHIIVKRLYEEMKREDASC